MAVTSIALYTLAVLLIAHSGYSAYEASYNAKLMAQKIAVPIDIKIEALIGVFLACFTPVLSIAGTLKPVKFADAASELELKGENPFLYLEKRSGFQTYSGMIENLRVQHLEGQKTK
ncbi:hypothetical protein B0I72DRAFT_134231 [Yarrowia lipolytica]|uniref:Uncharacterized protein n=1 Tax=Yarrowia lipolytica TaxID=4952 RepID=A0A1D8NGZ6_YARLL|nr:hypothetical protein YALI1_E04349g [Yarrowia lipolytica]KAB8286266.1 hypothetical protein BKA91DRAFT_132193 [Yarrowia lipolytica]KAE8174680.1 hypothetical protein BKA90DRAFT_133805 [Yarrowia lipolytica]KAJ8056484.1 hypothetical protein LXG23DRAFT_53202 [Yarrowia lipolytica]QNP98767.1 Hypothetical protein YALI2_E00083g [Yarrowia lipolytica]